MSRALPVSPLTQAERIENEACEALAEDVARVYGETPTQTDYIRGAAMAAGMIAARIRQRRQPPVESQR